MKYVGFLFLALLLFSCGSIQVYTDYDENVRLEEMRSYDFYEDMETGLNDLDEKRVFAALEKELENRNFNTSDQPDFKINLYTEAYQKHSQNVIGLNIGTYGNHVGGQIGSGIPINSTEDMLRITIEFARASTDELFWQGIVEDSMKPNESPKDREARLAQMIKKLMGKYPIKSL